MNPESDVKFISERRIFSANEKMRALAIFSCVTAVVLLGGYWFYLSYNIVPLPTPIENFGLTDQSGSSGLSGSLSFTAVIKDGESRIPHIFSKSTTDTEGGLEVPFPARSFDKGLGGVDVMIAPIPDTTDPDIWQPVWHDSAKDREGALPHGKNEFNENEIVISPDNIHYAYIYQATDNRTSVNLSEWNIAIYNYDTSEFFTISGASEPAFVRGGSELYYMKQDGIYSYSLASSTHVKISDRYNNLSMIDDYAVTNNGQTIILTIPSLALISVQGVVSAGIVNELGRIVSTDTRYRYPTISPDGEHYAVLAARPDTAGEFANVTAEIRGIEARTPTTAIDFPDVIPQSIQLNAWYDNNVDTQSQLLVE